MNLFGRLKEGLAKTRNNLVQRISSLALGKNASAEAVLEELEEALLGADVGVATTLKLTAALRSALKAGKIRTAVELRANLREQIRTILTGGADTPAVPRTAGTPQVMMVVGVNGVGKTTTIAKLARLRQAGGEKVLLAAGDTFRAAAIDQLEIWGNRTGVPVVRHKEGADPAAVVFDALQAAKARGMDLVIVDTAGRLHTKVNLMEELKKIKRVIGREISGAPQETLLVVDATTGQNAISQVQQFAAAVQVTGIVLTKLDGTAKGGIVIAIKDTLGIPIRYIGIGENLEDLQEFEPNGFIEALLGED